MDLTLIIPGAPIAKKRPRFARRGKFVSTYDCQETEEGRFMWEVKSQLPKDFELLEKGTPVTMECCFYFPIPKSVSNKKYAMMQDQKIRHTKKPDLDNLLKFVKDCLNSIIWHDDSQVVHVEAIKEYSDNPRTTIKIRILEL